MWHNYGFYCQTFLSLPSPYVHLYPVRAGREKTEFLLTQQFSNWGGRQILSGLCNYLRFIVVFSILGSQKFENIFKGSQYKKNWEALFINLILSIGTAWDFFPSFAWLHFPASSSFSRFRSFWTGITFSRLEELPMSRGRMSEGGAFSSSWESKDLKKHVYLWTIKVKC